MMDKNTLNALWRRIIRWSLGIGLVLGVFLLVFWAACAVTESTEPVVVHYSVPTEIDNQIRIVQLTDLHGWEFGEKNQRLVELVTAQAPDLILMTGDMLSRSDENAEVACDLIRRLLPIAPVYYGYGNHEYAWMTNHGQSLTPVLEAAGAIVLDVAYTDVEINGQALRIGGYHGYYRQPHMYTIVKAEMERELEFCEAFEDTDRYKILLSHVPTAWLDWGYMDQYPVDLVLSGHYHGGQVRLPLIGGVYAPYVGLFPEYTRGMYTGAEAVCILSAGLGTGPKIPRINSLPELTVVDLISNSAG